MSCGEALASSPTKAFPKLLFFPLLQLLISRWRQGLWGNFLGKAGWLAAGRPDWWWWASQLSQLGLLTHSLTHSGLLASWLQNKSSCQLQREFRMSPSHLVLDVFTRGASWSLDWQDLSLRWVTDHLKLTSQQQSCMVDSQCKWVWRSVKKKRCATPSHKIDLFLQHRVR